MMPAVNPRQLLAAAMASGGSGANPPDAMPVPGAAGPLAGAPTGQQGGLQDSLPSQYAGAQPTGLENSNVMSTADLQNQMGVGANASDATGQAVTGIIQAIQDPNTPPDQKSMLQAQLQLAALKALTSGQPQAAPK